MAIPSPECSLTRTIPESSGIASAVLPPLIAVAIPWFTTFAVCWITTSGFIEETRAAASSFGIETCTIAIAIPFIYLTSKDSTWIYLGVLLMALIVGGKDTLNPAWLAERFPTEVRATASGFVYHQGAIWGGMVAPGLSYLAVEKGYGFAQPMLWFTVVSLAVMVVAIYLGPETKGKVLVADIEVNKKAEVP